MVIRVLRPEVVGKIAAGEVVERPFSVLKELVENSLDAGAGEIAVELEEGGKSLVRVRDNGRGMTPEDLALAFVQHATSKLANVEELDRIASLGFRGEALASIGAVSRARILSRVRGSKQGAEVRADGGRISDVRPAAAEGTIVEVRDLFHNVPARRRFLKSEAAERARCLEVLTRLALAHPATGFVIEGKRRLSLHAGEELGERVGKLFGRELQARCLRVRYERGGIHVEGLVVDPDAARNDRKQLHLFVNGRPIRDRSLSHAVEDAYRDYLMGGKHPVTFLFLAMDPERVDVNVHPTKAEVRFADARLVYATLRASVSLALAQRSGHVAERAAASARDAPRPVTGFPDLPPGLFGRAEGIGASFGTVAPASGPAGRELAREHAPVAPGTARRSPFRATNRFLVLRDLYIVLETDDGFAIVDQHALHERVVYEEMLAAWRRGSVPVQRLLMPAIVELSPAGKEVLLAHADVLRRAGLPVSDFGGSAVKLDGYPAALKRVDGRRLLEGFLRELEAGEPPREPEDVRERFHSAACRSAVMAGDRLSETEIEELLRAAAKLEHPHNCPHGRPTVLSYSLGQLERFFRRKT